MMRVELSKLAATVCALLLAIPLTAANKPAAAKMKKSGTTTVAMRSAWPPERLSGKIAMVDFNRKLAVKTRIKSGAQAVALKDLTLDLNKPVSVKFTPERRGDMARSIRIAG
jgi:hypothetical protein